MSKRRSSPRPWSAAVVIGWTVLCGAASAPSAKPRGAPGADEPRRTLAALAAPRPQDAAESRYARLQEACRVVASGAEGAAAAHYERFRSELVAVIDGYAAELERITGETGLRRYRKPVLDDAARRTKAPGVPEIAARTEISHAYGRETFARDAAEVSHAYRSVLVSRGSIRISHAYDSVVFAEGDVTIGHANRCLIVAGGGVRISHDGSERRTDAARSDRSWIVAGGDVDVANAWGSVIATNGTVTIAWESDVLRCGAGSGPDAAASRPSPERGVEIGRGPPRSPRRSFAPMVADPPRPAPMRPASRPADSRPAESRPGSEPRGEGGAK